MWWSPCRIKVAPSVQRRKVWQTFTTKVQCSAVTLRRRETRWNFQGCPKLANRSQPLVGRKFTILAGHVEEVLPFNKFFRLSIYALVPKIWADKVVRRRQNGDFLRPVYPASRVQHISDLHSKFALGPHHVWKYGTHPTCDRWNKARKKGKRKETTGQKYNGLRYFIGRP